MIEVVPATLEHAAALAPNLRPADVAEIHAATGAGASKALARSVAMSTHAWASLQDGAVICLAGAGPSCLIGREGVAWLLASPAIETVPYRFFVESRRRLAECLRSYDVLRNWIDCRNTKTVPWLRWLGATFGEPRPYGHLRLPFMPFEIRAHV